MLVKEGDACGRAASREKRANPRPVVLLPLKKLGDKSGVAHVQNLRRMRLDETCLSTPHRYCETKPWVLSRPKSVRGERQYLIFTVRRNVRSELVLCCFELLSELRVDCFAFRPMRYFEFSKRILLGAAADRRARPVAGTVAGVAAKHTGQTSSELQCLACGSGSSQLVRQKACGVTAPDLDAAEKKAFVDASAGGAIDGRTEASP